MSEAVQRVSIEQVALYLMRHGWVNHSAHRDICTVWHHLDDPEVELMLPMPLLVPASSPADFNRRMVNVFTALVAHEGRDAGVIFDEIQSTMAAPSSRTGSENTRQG